MTEAPVVERTQIDRACQLCGSSIEVRFSEERVETFCTECAGMWGRDGATPHGYLGSKFLPPAGVRERTPADLFDVAWTWTTLEFFVLASDICPRCSATLDVGRSVCKDHDATGGLCATCDNRYAVKLHFRCPNCILAVNGSPPIYLVTTTDLLDLLTSPGPNPVSPDTPADVQRVLSNYDEEILSIEPFEARFTFAVEQETLTLTVDEDLSVVDVVRSQTSEPV